MGRTISFDIEANGLIDESSVDYTASPWKMKPTYVIHCIVAIDKHTGEVFRFVQEDVHKFKQFVEEEVDCVIGFNSINFDMLCCKVMLGMDYTVYPDTWCGKPVVIEDLYVKSKLLNPDRKGHSLHYFGELLGEPKTDWRAEAISLGLIEHNAPRGAEFIQFHPRMVDYCQQDNVVTLKVDKYLSAEWGDWPWDDAYQLEKAVAEIITRQSHRGFWFDTDLALKNLKELDELMEERRCIVEPHLPPKPLGKTKLKEYIPCKNQFLKSGKPSTNIEKWIVKHGGELTYNEESCKWETSLYGKQYTLPIPQEPILDSEPSKIDDSTFIKEFLVKMGWKPTSYKERDLTLDSKKQKITYEKFEAAVQKYVEQTLASPFCDDRLERVSSTRNGLLKKLLGHDLKKPLKVYTNPTFCVGQEKEIDPKLEEMQSEFPYARQIVEYLTYKHRRNSILGGGVDPDDWDADEDDTTSKGFLANVRSDHRIPTPADTCGAATGRFKHKICVNVPRVTTLYGAPMRSLFGIGDPSQYVQFAWDFASLEARGEAHYCWKFDDEDHAYCNSLLQEKPNDVHSVTARKISELILREFPRSSAKSVKYASTFGAQAARIAKTIGCDLSLGQKIFDAFWKAALPLAKLKETVENWWKTKGNKKFIPGLDGRKINTRSQHALLNSLFQSWGVICAKRTMVYQEKLIKEAGLSCDFWKDDWKNKIYIQQMCQNHDEVQMEMSKSLIKWKKFESDELAKQFCDSNEDWIGPLHFDGYVFCAHSIMNNICKEAVKLTNEHYKLNIDLAVDPTYGRNWCETH